MHGAKLFKNKKHKKHTGPAAATLDGGHLSKEINLNGQKSYQKDESDTKLMGKFIYLNIIELIWVLPSK